MLPHTGTKSRSTSSIVESDPGSGVVGETETAKSVNIQGKVREFVFGQMF